MGLSVWLETWILNLKNLWARLDRAICGCESNPEKRFQRGERENPKGKILREREKFGGGLVAICKAKRGLGRRGGEVRCGWINIICWSIHNGADGF
jgi:hypothetical protein